MNPAETPDFEDTDTDRFIALAEALGDARREAQELRVELARMHGHREADEMAARQEEEADARAKEEKRQWMKDLQDSGIISSLMSLATTLSTPRKVYSTPPFPGQPTPCPCNQAPVGVFPGMHVVGGPPQYPVPPATTTTDNFESPITKDQIISAFGDYLQKLDKVQFEAMYEVLKSAWAEVRTREPASPSVGGPESA